MDQDRIHTEYGAFFSLSAGQSGATHLSWERVRSEAALPPEARTLQQDLLATFVDRLVCEAAVPPIAAALEPLAAAVGVEVHAPDLYASSAARGLGISFRCSLPVATLVTAFRWEEPVASLGDHSTSSAVGPLAAALAPPWIPVLLEHPPGCLSGEGAREAAPGRLAPVCRVRQERSTVTIRSSHVYRVPSPSRSQHCSGDGSISLRVM